MEAITFLFRHSQARLRLFAGLTLTAWLAGRCGRGTKPLLAGVASAPARTTFRIREAAVWAGNTTNALGAVGFPFLTAGAVRIALAGGEA